MPSQLARSQAHRAKGARTQRPVRSVSSCGNLYATGLNAPLELQHGGLHYVLTDMAGSTACAAAHAHEAAKAAVRVASVAEGVTLIRAQGSRTGAVEGR